MTEHTCHCARCNPSLFAFPDWLGDGHYGLRFGNGQAVKTVLFNGAPVGSQTIECYAHPTDGWVHVYWVEPFSTGPRHECATCFQRDSSPDRQRSLCMAVLRGNVKVVLRDPVPA